MCMLSKICMVDRTVICIYYTSMHGAAQTTPNVLGTPLPF